jgi:hypothetical protein
MLDAGSVLLALTLLELGHNAYIALLGHTQVPLDRRIVHIAHQDLHRYKERHRAHLVLWELTAPPIHAFPALVGRTLLWLGRRAALIVL